MIETFSSGLATGIGLRQPHWEEIMTRRPSVGWLEVHPENFMHDGPGVEHLEALRPHYPLSLHSVGLSLASADGLDQAHLDRLSTLVDRLRPALVSAHLAWTMIDGVYLNDLLPVPYNRQSLRVVSENVDRAQDRLGRRLLIENLSAYIGFSGTTMSEAEFLAELVERTGCGVLFDVNNVFVSASNLKFDIGEYVDSLPADAIGEIHLAGHACNETADGPVLIDDHGSAVKDEVWSLYATAVERFGPRPALIEWDADVPPLDVLLAEARKADAIATTIAGRHGHAFAA